MNKNQNIEVSGEVTQALPNATFKVILDDGSPEDLGGREILCTIAGKMRLYHIRVMPGDKVKVEITPYDKNRGRITFREKWAEIVKWKSKPVSKNAVSTAKLSGVKGKSTLPALTHVINNAKAKTKFLANVNY